LRSRRIARLSDGQLELLGRGGDRRHTHQLGGDVELDPGASVLGCDGLGDGSRAVAAGHVGDSEGDQWKAPFNVMKELSTLPSWECQENSEIFFSA
jgi:hypothetical protein